MTMSLATLFRRTAFVLTVEAALSLGAKAGFAYTLEAQQMCAGVATLMFLPVLPPPLQRNVRVKATPATNNV
jgi:hypothetical protein